jgi:hypothetical protein
MENSNDPAKQEDETKPWVDPDDAPELAKEWFEKATRRFNGVIIPRDKDA